MTYDLRLVPQSGELLAATPRMWQVIAESPGIVVEATTGYGVAYRDAAIPLRVDDYGILAQIPAEGLDAVAFVETAGHLRQLGQDLGLILLDVPRGRVWEPGAPPDLDAMKRPEPPPPPPAPTGPTPAQVQAWANDLLQLLVCDAAVGLAMAVAGTFGMFQSWNYLVDRLIDAVFLVVGIGSLWSASVRHGAWRHLAASPATAVRPEPPGDPVSHGALGAVVLLVGLYVLTHVIPSLHWTLVGGACFVFAAGEFFRLYRAVRSRRERS